ncbi:hypothetical protein TNCV_2508581 [Trichonephila clavipes]|nr:hypothetical protein TNCV_2508581 [Trichonephila clavipes]
MPSIRRISPVWIGQHTHRLESIEHVWDMLGRRIAAVNSLPPVYRNFEGNCLSAEQDETRIGSSRALFCDHAQSGCEFFPKLLPREQKNNILQFVHDLLDAIKAESGFLRLLDCS